MRRWWVPGLGRYLIAHPSNIASVVRAGWRLRRANWWRSPPYLPLPANAFWDFRLATVNGDDGHLEPHDVVSVARWSALQNVGR